MADDNSKSTNGLYRVEREWTVGRLAPALLLVSSMRPASNPSALVAFAGKMHPPRPLLCDDTLLVSSLHVTYTAGCVVVLFFFSLSPLLPLCTLRDNISREGTIQQQGMEEYSYSLFFVDRNLFVVRKLEGGGYACDNNFFESLQTIEKGEKVEG